MNTSKYFSGSMTCDAALLNVHDTHTHILRFKHTKPVYHVSIAGTSNSNSLTSCIYKEELSDDVVSPKAIPSTRRGCVCFLTITRGFSYSQMQKIVSIIQIIRMIKSLQVRFVCKYENTLLTKTKARTETHLKIDTV